MTKQPAVDDKPRGRPTLEESRRLDDGIRNAALDLFLDHGYDATTMDAVALAAGITKRTLYKRYRDKAELFSAAMRKLRDDWPEDEPHDADAGGSLAEELGLLANALLKQTLDERTVKLARIASAQAEQFPGEITKAYDISLSPRIASVTGVLERHTDEIAEQFSAELPLVAELFIGMVTGIPARLAGFGKRRAQSLESRRVSVAVDLFVQGIGRSPVGGDAPPAR